MQGIHRYIDCYVPITTCNLRCHYCYITLAGKFKNEPVQLRYTPEHVRQALSQKRMGGLCFINLCAGGETLLLPSIVAYIKCMLEEGHYVSIVTNGTISKRFDEMLELDVALRQRLFFKFSYHYLELKRTGQLESFFANIKKMSDAGCSFTLEVTPSDELEEEIGPLSQLALDQVGALPHITVARDSTQAHLPILTQHKREEYYKIWNDAFDSSLFRYKMEIFGVKRHEFCYAGAWSYYLHLGNGLISVCYFGNVIENFFDSVPTPPRQKAIACQCPDPHCYNGHGWIAWGDIPSLNAPTYFDLRNRTTTNGSEWIKEPVKSFFKTKLAGTNAEYGNFKKAFINARRCLKL